MKEMITFMVKLFVVSQYKSKRQLRKCIPSVEDHPHLWHRLKSPLSQLLASLSCLRTKGTGYGIRGPAHKFMFDLCLSLGFIILLLQRINLYMLVHMCEDQWDVGSGTIVSSNIPSTTN